jgi:hypothetical protein
VATRASDKTDSTEVDILDDRPADDGFFDTLQREMSVDPVAQAHVENGPQVMLNVTAMLEPWGQDCVEVYWPEPARDVQKMTVAESDRLQRGLAAANAAAGHYRSMQGNGQ